MSRYFDPLKYGALLLLAVAVVACGKARPSSYYTLDVSPASSGSTTLVGKQVGVALPRAAHLLRQDRIVYFTGDNQMNFYQYHRWGQPPVFMVQSLLIRQLRGARLFDDVVPYRAQKGLDYILRGRLLAMEEVDAETEITARFGLELELVRQEENHVVWTGRDRCERAVGVKSVSAVVEAMSGCVQESLNKLTRSLEAVAPELERAKTNQ